MIFKSIVGFFYKKNRYFLFSLILIFFALPVLGFVVFKFFVSTQEKDFTQEERLLQPTPTSQPEVLGEEVQTKENQAPDEPLEQPITSPVTISTPTPTSVPDQSPTQTPSTANSTPIPESQRVTFNVVLQDPVRDTISDLTFSFAQVTGPETLKSLEIKIPAGWDIVPGNSIGEGEQVGDGNLTFVLDGVPGEVPVTIINSQDTQGFWASWKVMFGSTNSPFVTLDTFLERNAGQGYVWRINRKFLFDIKPPITLNLRILAKYTKKPENPGEFIFEQIANFVDGVSRVFRNTISLL